MPDVLFDTDGVLDALRMLGQRLASRGIVADLYIFGGAAMVVAYQRRLATRDIDAIFEPDSQVHEAADELAREFGWPRSWLNNQASVYLSALPDDRRKLVLDSPGIRVMTASGEHLLAMKLLASRVARDATDIRLLVRHLQLRSPDQALQILDDVYPGAKLSDRGRLLLEDVFDEL